MGDTSEVSEPMTELEGGLSTRKRACEYSRVSSHSLGCGVDSSQPLVSTKQ